MEIGVRVNLPNKKFAVVGTCKLSETELVFYRKSMVMGVLFGAIGSALASKKEFLRIETKDIVSVKKDKFKMNKKACYLTVKDGQTYIIAFYRPDQTIEFLQQVTKQQEE